MKSEHFHAMIVETYLESVLIIDATLNNTDLDKIVSYIYSNPVKNHPLVTLIKNKTVTLEGNPYLKDASGTIWVDSELNERLATAKGYLQRPALLESMKTLGDKNSTPKKIKI